MQINNQFKGEQTVFAAPVTQHYKDSGAQAAETEIICEHTLDVYVNEVLTMKLTCLANQLTELTLGRLLSEGIIRSTEDVDYLYICEFGRRAKVFLAPELTAKKGDEPYVELTPTCCTGNQILNDSFVRQNGLTVLPKGTWKPEDVFLCMERFAEDTPLHARTQFTHSCYLLVDGKIVFETEDIGRHNAVDKALGWALLNDVDLQKAILFTSGRVPTDMAVKVIRAGVPVLICKEAVTKEALELAQSFGLTLISRARRDSFMISAQQ